MTVYCNGYRCNAPDKYKQTLTNASNSKVIILNYINDAVNISGCYQVAYDKVSLWDRQLTQEELQGLRLAPLKSALTTTASTATQAGGPGSGGNTEKPTTPALTTEEGNSVFKYNTPISTK